MRRAMIQAQFPDLLAHNSSLSATAIGSNTVAAIGKALRKLLASEALKKKHIHSIKLTVSLTTVNMQAVEKAMEQPMLMEPGLTIPEFMIPGAPIIDAEFEDTEEKPKEPVLMCEDHDVPLSANGFCDKCGFNPDMQSTYVQKLPEPQPHKETPKCKYCFEEVPGSLTKHLNECPQKRRV